MADDDRILITLTLPLDAAGPSPAIVLVAGHGGTHKTCYESAYGYHQIGRRLAEAGYATISTSVSQHETRRPDTTLQGERLASLMGCVDYLRSLPEIDPEQIGCAGKSLGGEMAMWLGAMDTRVGPVVSCGFLTTMDHMETDHCMCWKLPGLRALVDFADIYALHAPKPLQCQNGEKEPPSQFPISVARVALADIKPVYDALGHAERLEFVSHPGGHEFDVAATLDFFERAFTRPPPGPLDSR